MALPSFEHTRARLAGPDLARALAIVFVLISHDGGIVCQWWGTVQPPGLAALGFWGVMLFFVLSGFLIGTLMLDLLRHDGAPRDWPPLWGSFLLRRWLRTLPAYYVFFLLAAVPLELLGPFGVPRAEAARVWPYYATLTQNLFWPPVSGWFGVSWSLCIEEWFYLAFPLCLVLARLAGLTRGRAFALTLALFFVVPVLCRLSLPPDVNWDEATSKIVPCRLDSLAWGVAAAWLQRDSARFRHAWRPLLAVGLGILGITWALGASGIALWSVRFQKMALFDVAGCGYALCVPAMMRLRRLPPLPGGIVRTLSTYSYGLYLSHLSIMLLAGDLHGRYGLGRPVTLAFAAAATIAWPVLSWLLVERPCLSARPPQYVPAYAARAAAGAS
ncbi:acyltransferase family protein [Acidomonas methanolica]|uniref:acyltransferase family protein n=1 Tax=Acidomonas methanolica TaxID=437 RepID=UPI00211A559B|nr:acyltransferase [Acidomonas methanolica]MCQ9155265.1 acyltransferase [Acidomonas methanolica]